MIGTATLIAIGMAAAIVTEQRAKHLRQKGGEKNEKPPITFVKPALVLNFVLGRAGARRGRDGH
jgi:hypothetical protein